MPLITATKIVRFALLTILKKTKNIQISSTVIDTPNTKFIILVWVFADDDDVDNEMIM